MAKVTLVSPIGTMRGRQGDQVFSMLGRQPLARRFVTPRNPQSAPQLEIRGIMTAVSQLYSGLTRSVAETWDAAAANLPERTSETGIAYPVTGRVLFQEVNTMRLLRGQSTTTTAPATTAPSVPIITQPAQFDISSALLIIPVDNSELLNDGDIYRVRITCPLPTNVVQASPSWLRSPDWEDSSKSFTTGTMIKAEEGTIVLHPDSSKCGVFGSATVLRFGFEVMCLNSAYVRRNSPTFYRSWTFTKTNP